MPSGETYIQLADGKIVGPSVPLPVSGNNVFATDVTVHDPSVTSQKLAIDPQGRVATTFGRSLAAVGQKATGVNGAAVKIVDASATRAFVRVTNTSIHTLFVSTASGVTASTGHAIPAGTSQDFPAQGALYAASVTTADTLTFADFNG